MAQIVSNIIQNSLSGFVAGAVTTVGGYAGDAVCGVGNLIERRGQALGDGIAKRFDVWGQGISSYGTTARNATSPNSPATARPVKRIDGTKKSTVGTKKALPSSGPAKKKALPAAPERKLLMPPPPKDGKIKDKNLDTYASSVAPYKQNQRSVAPSVVSKATTARPQISRARSDVSTATTAKKAQPSKWENKSTALPRSTTVGGKVVPQKRSLPGTKAKGGASSGKPTANVNKTIDSQRYGGYQGPLNLGGISDMNGGKGNQKSRTAPSVAGSVAKGDSKSKDVGYQGPLDIGGLVK